MENQFVIFGIEELKYALKINLVNEITNACTISPIPNNSKIIEGVVSLRGDVTPVINLRKILCLDRFTPKDHQIIFIKSEYGNYGLIIDVAYDVRTYREEQIIPINEIGLADGAIISSIINSNGEIIQLISVDQLLIGSDLINSKKMEMITC